jgi:signal transduction histidine kinase
VSFRARLLLTSLVTLGVGLGALLIVGNVLLARHVHSETSGLLRGRAEAQVAALEVTPRGVRVRETANDDILDRQAWVFSGHRLVERPSGASAQVDAAAVALARAGEAAEVDGPGEYRLRAQPVFPPGGDTQVGTIVVAESTEALEGLQKRVLIGSLVFAALVLLAGGLATWRALAGALEPVATMTAAARDWGAHDLDHRFGLGPPRDELTGLAATLDALLARIAASRRHEQRFASETAHELRTPLTGLRGRAELALAADTDKARSEHEAALKAVVSQAERMDEVIETLLTVARQELSEGEATVDLGALAQEFDGIDVSVATGLPAAEGEPEIARRMLAPLVDNARRHARDRVSLDVAADEEWVRVTVRDDGPGIDDNETERVFEPGFQGSYRPGGAGLGLALARRLARSCGGDVTAAPGTGGCFYLSLPRALT